MEIAFSFDKRQSSHIFELITLSIIYVWLQKKLKSLSEGTFGCVFKSEVCTKPNDNIINKMTHLHQK